MEAPGGGTAAAYKGIPPEYEVLHRCGEGTFGQVFLCRSKEGRHVAIKTIKQEAAKQESEGMPVTTIREAMLLRELRHPNVLHLHAVHIDTWQEGSFTLSLVFEFVDHDVHEMMQCQKGFGAAGQPRLPVQHFPGEMVRSMLWQLLQGLAYLHQSWIIHRDLKPSNLLVSGVEHPKPGRLKIADFGLARVFRAPARPLHENGVVVTIWYRAPELLFGMRHYSTAVDMWAAGCIFGELLTLSALFPGNEVREPLDAFQLDQLQRIFAVLGMPTEAAWPALAHAAHWQGNTQGVRDVHPERAPCLEAHLLSCNPALAHDRRKDAAIDLLSRLLQYDPAKRLTAEEALKHRYFADAPQPSLNMFPAGFQPRYVSKTSHEAPVKKRAAAPAAPGGPAALSGGVPPPRSMSVAAASARGIGAGGKGAAKGKGGAAGKGASAAAAAARKPPSGLAAQGRKTGAAGDKAGEGKRKVSRTDDARGDAKKRPKK